MTTAIDSPRTDPVPHCASDSVAASHTLAHCVERETRVVSIASVHTAWQLATQLIEKTSPCPRAEAHLVPNGRHPKPQAYGAQRTI